MFYNKHLLNTKPLKFVFVRSNGCILHLNKKNKNNLKTVYKLNGRCFETFIESIWKFCFRYRFILDKRVSILKRFYFLRHKYDRKYVFFLLLR